MREKVTLDPGAEHRAKIEQAYRWLGGKRPRAAVDRAEALAMAYLETGAQAFPVSLGEFEELAIPGATGAVRSAVVNRLVAAKLIRISMRGRGVTVLAGPACGSAASEATTRSPHDQPLRPLSA